MLLAGDKLPEFTLKDQDGMERNISEFIGERNLVLYFYPMDFTPGCTKEACSFRDNYQHLNELGAEVVGVSSDSPKRHAEFKSKYKLPFTLLSDKNKKVRKLLGMKGKLLGLIPERVTFIIDKNGVVSEVFDALLQYDAHVERALKRLQNKT